MANGLSLVAGGPSRAAIESAVPAGAGERWRAPKPRGPTLEEVFAATPRDSGWAGFLASLVERDRPILWVQERMAILETGRVHPPGLGPIDLVHVETRDSRSVLWAMEEGLRCRSLSAVIGEIWGDPAALDFTATRRLAVAAERNGVAAFLIRLGGHANLSGARMRWRVSSRPSLPHPFDPRAPGAESWDLHLFRARGSPPGRWIIARETYSGAAHLVHLVSEPGFGTVAQDERRSA